MLAANVFIPTAKPDISLRGPTSANSTQLVWTRSLSRNYAVTRSFSSDGEDRHSTHDNSQHPANCLDTCGDVVKLCYIHEFSIAFLYYVQSTIDVALEDLLFADDSCVRRCEHSFHVLEKGLWCKRGNKRNKNK